MYELEILDPSRIRDFKALIYPSDARWQLESLLPVGTPTGVLAHVKGQALGLAVVMVHSKSGFAYVVSLYVEPTSRNKGIGTALLQKIEEYLKKESGLIVCLNFKHEEPDEVPLQKVLEKCGWERPQVHGYQFYSTIERFLTDLAWTQRQRTYPYHSYIFPWTNLTAEEKQKLKEEEGPNSWRATQTSPFFFDGHFEPQTSLGLRVEGEVVGWIINHLIKPDTLLYGSYFVRPRFRGLGHSIGLLLESIKLQKKAGIPVLTWYVNASDNAVKTFYQKLLSPCVTREEEWWSSAKPLNETPLK